MAATYTAQQRAEILRLAQEVGPLEAAKRKGVPPGTVTAWRCLENKRAKLAKRPEPPEPQKPAVSESPKRLTGKKVARLYTPSEKAAALELVQQLGVSETHRKTGISRFSLYEWARIHEKAMQQKHLSDPLADQTPAKNDRDALVLAEGNKYPGLGPSQIRNQLRRAGVTISVRTVRMVMENNCGTWIFCKGILVSRKTACYLSSMIFTFIFDGLPCWGSSAPRLCSNASSRQLVVMASPKPS